MNNCVFCKIIKGEIPAVKVYEDERFLAFMDIDPIHDGQVVLIPKQHIEYVFDMGEPLFSEFFQVAKKISISLKKATQAKKIALVIEGFEIAHAHIKLIPADKPSDLDRINAFKADPKELIRLAERIRQAK